MLHIFPRCETLEKEERARRREGGSLQIEKGDAEVASQEREKCGASISPEGKARWRWRRLAGGEQEVAARREGKIDRVLDFFLVKNQTLFH